MVRTDLPGLKLFPTDFFSRRLFFFILIDSSSFFALRINASLIENCVTNYKMNSILKIMKFFLGKVDPIVNFVTRYTDNPAPRLVEATLT